MDSLDFDDTKKNDDLDKIFTGHFNHDGKM